MTKQIHDYLLPTLIDATSRKLNDVINLLKSHDELDIEAIHQARAFIKILEIKLTVKQGHIIQEKLHFMIDDQTADDAFKEIAHMQTYVDMFYRCFGRI